MSMLRPTIDRANSGNPSVGISRWVMTVAPSLWRLTVAEWLMACVASHTRAWKASSVIMSKTISMDAG